MARLGHDARPHDEDYDAFIKYIVDVRGRWLAVHLAGLVIFPLVGIAVCWMLPPGAGWRATLVDSRLFPTWCCIRHSTPLLVLGTAIVAGYRQGLPVDQQPIADGIMELDGRVRPGLLPGRGSELCVGRGDRCCRGRIAAGADGVALPLAPGGAVLFHSHFPPFGAISGALLAIAAWQFLATRNVSWGTTDCAEAGIRAELVPVVAVGVGVGSRRHCCSVDSSRRSCSKWLGTILSAWPPPARSGRHRAAECACHRSKRRAHRSPRGPAQRVTLRYRAGSSRCAHSTARPEPQHRRLSRKRLASILEGFPIVFQLTAEHDA